MHQMQEGRMGLGEPDFETLAVAVAHQMQLKQNDK